MKKINPIETSVSEYLASIGVTFNAVLVGERKVDGWKHDAWVVSFSTGKVSADFDYKTGTGHRKSKTPMPSDIARLSPNIIARVDWEKRNLSPVRPPAAGVLYSLLLDSSAAGVSFGEWCGDFGYDTDSRKALGIYEACQQNGDMLKKIFNPEQLKTLSELLQDY